MAIAGDGIAVNKRLLVAIPGLSALACAAIMFYLIIQIDQTRKHLQSDGVLEFNFIQQVDHNFYTLAQSLTDYLIASDPASKDAMVANYITRYDVLYSSIHNVSNSWLGYLTELKETQNLISAAQEFIDRYEPLMAQDVVIDTNTILAINTEARALSTQVYNVGLQMFERKSIVRDNISRRMDDLYEAFWVFGLSFVIASMMTIALFIALSRRADDLSKDARQTQSQLTTALDELTTGDIERRAQNRFMAAASHDLRQPLHALGLYLSALKRHVNSDQGQVILTNIHRSTEALNQLLNSMLDLSKLDAGVVDVNHGHLRLDGVFDHLHQMFLPEANQRELALEIPYSGLCIYTDQVLLERILGNLVGNALNYTEKGKVSVHATVEGSEACIYVTDTGPGIPEHEQEAIFNEYYQLQNSERDRSKGLGLGLSIVKRLTRLLNIELSIYSIPDKGTQFKLKLPLGDKNQCNGPLTRQKSAVDDKNFSGLSILVIDDEHDVRDGMHTLLEQYNCTVVMADSSDHALNYIATNEWVPDLIIADYRLRDEKTGDTAIELVREEVNMDVPAMIITGDTSPARLREATASGFPLLHKPVIAEELIKAITNLVGDSK